MLLMPHPGTPGEKVPQEVRSLSFPLPTPLLLSLGFAPSDTPLPNPLRRNPVPSIVRSGLGKGSICHGEREDSEKDSLLHFTLMISRSHAHCTGKKPRPLAKVHPAKERRDPQNQAPGTWLPSARKVKESCHFPSSVLRRRRLADPSGSCIC